MNPLHVVGVFYNNRWHYLDGIKNPNTDGWTHNIAEAWCTTSTDKAAEIKKRYLQYPDFVARFGEPEILTIGGKKS